MKPDCYKCKFRGTILGDAHSCCCHPDVKGAIEDPMSNILATFASIGRYPPMAAIENNLNIKANYHGIVNGWFNWPWNFDPAWLENCDGFEEIENEKNG